jgi:hypothetical protein
MYSRAGPRYSSSGSTEGLNETKTKPPYTAVFAGSRSEYSSLENYGGLAVCPGTA